jgi:hypothetical protein
MKPQEQRIAIAGACGWTNCVVLGSGVFNLIEGNIPRVEGKAWTSTPHLVPNYLNDLNAMREAEKVLLTVNQQNRYQTEIAEICWSDEERGNNQVVFNQLTASATQRAEAFLRTLNLWTE